MSSTLVHKLFTANGLTNTATHYFGMHLLHSFQANLYHMIIRRSFIDEKRPLKCLV